MSTNQFVIVRHEFEVNTQAYYAQTAEEAHERRKMLEAETGSEWRVYRREVAAGGES